MMDQLSAFNFQSNQGSSFCHDKNTLTYEKMLRDCQKITFVTLSRVCPLSNPPPAHPFLTDNINLDVTSSNYK